MRQRKQLGLINLSKGKDYLAYSRQIGKVSAEKLRVRPALSKSLSLPSIQTSLVKEEGGSTNPDYLAFSHAFTNPILNRKKLNLAQNAFLSEPKNTEMNSSLRYRLDSQLE